MPSTRPAALTAAALLAGCAGSALAGSATAPGPSRIPAPASADRSWLARDANRHDPWLYVDSEHNAELLIYDLAKSGIPQIGKITTGLTSPTGMALDAKGTLYVSNYYGANVAIYPAGATTPSSTLSQGLIVPNGLAVDTNGDLYVANKSTDQGGTSSNILVYHAGQSSPFRTIASSLIQNPGELFFDAGRDLFIADGDTGISEIPFGSTQPVSLGLEGVTTWTGSVAVDPLDGNRYAAGMHDHRESVLAFAPGSVMSMGRLKTGAVTAYLSFGTVKGTEYLFVPDSGGDTVALFKHNINTPATVLKTVQYAQDAIVKPAGVP